MKTKLFSMGLAVLFVGMLAISAIQIADSREINPNVPYVDSPIRIDSNADFPGVASSGDGSVGNPWIIENLDINVTGIETGIYIGNTTEYVTIRNCTIYDADSEILFASGIYLYNCENSTLHNNTISRCFFAGIRHYLGNNNTFTNNTIFGSLAVVSYGYGIFNNMCNNGTIEYNLCYDNFYGIYLLESNDFWIYSNEIYNYEIYRNGWDTYGIVALSDIMSEYPARNNIIYNNIIYNFTYGILMSEMSISNYIYGNYFFLNLYNGTDNTIYYNYWNDTYNGSRGNYWGNYIGIDEYSGEFQNITGSDGVGDIPYIFITNTDFYPLMDNPFEPEVDLESPSINYTSPSDGATNVNIAIGSYSIQFSEPMNSSIGLFTTNLPNLTFDWSNDTIWVNGTFGELDYNTTYYANLTNFEDLAGNPLSATNLTFTTELEPTTGEILTELVISLMQVMIVLIVLVVVLKFTMNMFNKKKE